MWQSFAAIGRGTSEIWLSKEKNICGKTEARPELIVPGGLKTFRHLSSNELVVQLVVAQSSVAQSVCCPDNCTLE